MKKIAVEEHFTTPRYLELSRALFQLDQTKRNSLKEYYLDIELAWVKPDSDINRKLVDMGGGRIQEMTEAGVDMQVISLRCPGVQVFDAATGTDLAKETNDSLSEAVNCNPHNFVGLAAIAPQDPVAAVKEIERAVLKLGLKGININSSTKDEYLDDRKYWPIFARAEQLGVPVYIHPRMPSPSMVKPYLGYPNLTQALFGYGAEVAIHATRLICSGLFDEFPKLNIILGHLGEALPFWMWRMDNTWVRSPLAKMNKKLPSEYMKNNFYISTSGNFSVPSFMCAYSTFGPERMMFAIDYPIESSAGAARFIEEVPIPDRDKEMICHTNAEKVFSIS